jgi:hypothetical protein
MKTAGTIGWMAVCLWMGALGISRGEEKKNPESLGEFLERIQVKLDHTAQRVNQPNKGGSSVVGLRGSKKENTSQQLYWKGKNKPAEATPEEVKMFRNAVEEARAGRKAEAISLLNNFQAKYPQSALLADVKETLHRLGEGGLSSTPAAVIASTPTAPPASAKPTSEEPAWNAVTSSPTKSK